MKKVLGVIPSRYASTRFPGKPLVDINGKSMIRRVVEQCQKAEKLDKVIVATDDKRIYDHVLEFGGNAMMTADTHKSGTERCGEVIEKLEDKEEDELKYAKKVYQIIQQLDSKVSLDDNSLFRHKDYAELRDTSEEDPTEVEADEIGLNFVKLDGNVGCMVNGAGLAMATMDIIKLSGGNPANFLDVGGTADAERVEKAFNIILKDKNVKAILINIFGGIVRCDRVAQGVVDAYKKFGEFPVPLIVRLQGTNAVEAKTLIDNSGLNVISVVQLQDAADKVKEVLA